MKMIRKQLLLRIGVALLATLAAAYLYVQLRSVGIAASKSGPERISAHVYVVKEGRRGAMSNVGFVVGDAAALVIDSGLGSRNGRILAGELQRIAANRSIYVAATHFHPEHMLGESAFTTSATVLRSTAQQRDIDKYGRVFINLFRIMYPVAMAGTDYRDADRLFDQDMTLDLGGVRVQIMSLGPAHTAGDLGFYVEGDRIAFTGDVAMSTPLGINARDSLVMSSSVATRWLQSLERVAALGPSVVVPSHGPLGDFSMIERHRVLMSNLHNQVADWKRKGKSVDEVAADAVQEFGGRYASRSVEGAARLFYAEVQ